MHHAGPHQSQEQRETPTYAWSNLTAAAVGSDVSDDPVGISMEQSPSYNPALLAAHSPTSSYSTTTVTATTTPNKKKRVTAVTGSRGVANLTPEQLAKKRANDREAQRAIRERTKGQIEQLEKRIQELTAQRPYQELQDVVRQKRLVEAENEDIRKRLASVMSILQPICGGALGI